VHRSLHRFDPRKGAFSTWLYRITVNYCLNKHRKRYTLILSLEDVSAVYANEFPGVQLDEKEAIEQALNRLSDRQKVVIILRYYWTLPLLRDIRNSGYSAGNGKIPSRSGTENHAETPE